MTRPSFSTRLKSEIAEVESKLTALNQRLDDLRLAERVLLSLGDDDDASEDSSDRAHTIPDMVENALAGGALEAHEIYEKIQEAGRQTTLNTITSTLSRMKSEERLLNEEGKWFLPPKR
jgi:isopentenyl diphosphate isomerase/L-lactate dehydrogenase-like FMN-dependent dehydrogenase